MNGKCRKLLTMPFDCSDLFALGGWNSSGNAVCILIILVSH
uniref:Uncharacterized protein n=1 Tax=Rhizophora mucronata TaxID=61149 RepID=A0A2P2P508_RHIMU